MIVIVVVVREVRKTLCRVGGRGGGRWLTAKEVDKGEVGM